MVNTWVSSVKMTSIIRYLPSCPAAAALYSATLRHHACVASIALLRVCLFFCEQSNEPRTRSDRRWETAISLGRPQWFPNSSLEIILLAIKERDQTISDFKIFEKQLSQLVQSFTTMFFYPFRCVWPNFRMLILRHVYTLAPMRLYSSRTSLINQYPH